MNEIDRQGRTPDPRPEADPAPSLLSVLWSYTDDAYLASAQALADAFGGPVVEPTRWPVGAGTSEYVLKPPNPVSPLRDVPSYGIARELPGHPVRLIVAGREGKSPHRAGRNGWFAVPDLAEVNGLGRDDGPVAHVCVELGEQVIHVTMFPSVDEAVAAAASLEVTHPRGAP